MAQRVDVAIVFRDMLGDKDALSYMAGCGLPAGVVTRVLAGQAVTRIVAPAAARGAADDERDERHAAQSGGAQAHVICVWPRAAARRSTGSS